MKNGLLNSFFRMAAAFALLLSAGACKDDVALPMQSITLSSHAILAPSFATTLSFDVAANCEWQIFVTGNDDGWAFSGFGDGDSYRIGDGRREHDCAESFIDDPGRGQT